MVGRRAVQPFSRAFDAPKNVTAANDDTNFGSNFYGSFNFLGNSVRRFGVNAVVTVPMSASPESFNNMRLNFGPLDISQYLPLHP